MCGIVGIVGSAGPNASICIQTMISSIAHRGPNGQKWLVLPDAAFGHARLSIIDLDERANQPMTSANGQYVIVFNGEIYNYKELKRELSTDYCFTTTSDTEVLLAAWCKWGEGCLRKLNGMFAFCIYDLKTSIAFLARDRFGQKPLFFTETEGCLFFASEIKAILSTGYHVRPNLNSWSRYLAHACFDDDENTFFEGIYQLRPGEYATYRDKGSLKRTTYYQIVDHIQPPPNSLRTATETVRDLMVDSVRIHMRADVPVGISLSGGLDSSAILSCLSLGSGVPNDLYCFSMEYGNDFSERPWIDATTNQFGLKSQYGVFTKEKFLASIRHTMWHQEAPIGGLPNCALEEIGRMAWQQSVPVIQDGTGLDEAFGGYQNHHNLYVALLLESNDPAALEALEAYARNWEVTSEMAKIAAVNERYGSGTAIDGTYPGRLDLLTPQTLAHAGERPNPDSPLDDPLKNTFIDYLQKRKIPRNMRMKDRATMAFGRELRLPFLDHRLVEYALSLPNDYYFLNGQSKSIVREAFSGTMDNGVRLASKRSLQAPQGAWIASNPMKSYVQEILSSESFSDRGFVDATRASDAYSDFCRQNTNNSLFIWQWINLEEWFRTFVDRDAIAEPSPACPEIHEKHPVTHSSVIT